MAAVLDSVRDTCPDTFVRAAEVWVPSADGARLQLESATHGGIQRFVGAGVPVACEAGFGVAGDAWALSRAVIRSVPADATFAPAREAAAPVAAAAIAMPVGADPAPRAVLVLVCGRRGVDGGALEVWQRADGRNELGITASHYGRLDRFQRLSVALRLGPGSGLPGRTWQSALPQIMDDLPHADSFLRAAAAESEGLATGIGLPVFEGTGVSAVVLMLGALHTPLVRAFEVWTPREDGEALRLEAASYADTDGFGTGAGALACAPKEGALGMAWATRMPLALDGPGLLGSPRAEAAAAAGLGTGLVLPIVRGSRVTAVVLMLN